MSTDVLKRMAAFVFMWCLVFSAYAIDVPLTYQHHPDEQRQFYPYGGTSPNLKLERPAGEWKLPELKGKQPLYGLVEWGAKKRLLVLARQNEEDEFYNRLYFDSNANGDLIDDAAVDGKTEHSNGDYTYVSFPAVDTTAEIDGKALQYSFRAQANCWRLSEFKKTTLTPENIRNFFNFYIRVNCSYAGTFTLGEKTYHLALGDSNGNARFNDKLSRDPKMHFMEQDPVYLPGDQLYLSTEANLGYQDGSVLGDLLLLQGKLYELAINIPEGRMTLTETKSPLTTAKLPAETERLTIYTDDGAHAVMMYQPEMKVRVPAGKYRLASYQLQRKDKQGDLWLLDAMATGQTTEKKVGTGRQTKLEYGEPYRPTVFVPEWSRQNLKGGNNQVDLNFTVVGAGKEVVTDLAHVSGGKTKIALAKQNKSRPKEPTYKIVAKGGTVAAQGSFEYG
jgi:hypothetical protein